MTLHVSKKIFAFMFADDSIMFLTGKNGDDLIDIMNVEIVKVVEWLRVNKLSLNLKKTHFILLKKTRRKVFLRKDLIIDNVKIDYISKTKFLGVIIDEYLTFEHHIKFIKGKVSRGLGILHKCKRFLHENSLKQLYNSFIYPYLNYCIIVWGNTCQTHLLPLIRLQKRIIRMISGVKKYDHTDPLFKNLHVLKFEEIYAYSLQFLLYKFHHGIFSDFFTVNKAIHNHATRQTNLLHVHMTKSRLSSISVRRNGVRSFNYFYGILNLDCTISCYKM